MQRKKPPVYDREKLFTPIRLSSAFWTSHKIEAHVEKFHNALNTGRIERQSEPCKALFFQYRSATEDAAHYSSWLDMMGEGASVGANREPSAAEYAEQKKMLRELDRLSGKIERKCPGK
jgi:hypothetical protein